MSDFYAARRDTVVTFGCMSVVSGVLAVLPLSFAAAGLDDFGPRRPLRPDRNPWRGACLMGAAAVTGTVGWPVLFALSAVTMPVGCSGALVGAAGALGGLSFRELPPAESGAAARFAWLHARANDCNRLMGT